ncbi:cAMP-dependent protein kinase [Aureococcus anophagefferens]|nr:cAMP-dependent protein kinase [Aureococcus anophagefferens]
MLYCKSKLTPVGAGVSVQPKPAPDHGRHGRRREQQALAGVAGARGAGRARLSAPVGLEKPRPSPNGLRRASSNAGAGKNWTKAKYAVKGASAFGAAGAALAGRRAEARDGSRNGWIASSCHLGPASHRKLESFELVRVVGRGVMGEDKKKVYFVMEFVAGGELFSKLRGNQCLTAPVARFYLAEILSALAYVHANGFAYRDLRVRPRPPLPALGKDHKEDSHYAIYLRVIKGRISFPSFLGATPKSLVKALLKAGKGRLVDAPSITGHEFFGGVDFAAVEQRRVRPPQEPLVLSAGDASQFDEYRERPCPEDDLDSSKVSFAGF